MDTTDVNINITNSLNEDLNKVDKIEELQENTIIDNKIEDVKETEIVKYEEINFKLIEANFSVNNKTVNFYNGLSNLNEYSSKDINISQEEGINKLLSTIEELKLNTTNYLQKVLIEIITFHFGN